jgi:hypothetical protein
MGGTEARGAACMARGNAHRDIGCEELAGASSQPTGSAQVNPGLANLRVEATRHSSVLSPSHADGLRDLAPASVVLAFEPLQVNARDGERRVVEE